MKIGVVIHGPEVIDSGQAKAIIDILSAEGEVCARLGGTMGRTAVIDAGLENLIDTSQRLKPSESIGALSATSDVVFLLNHGKTTETGRAFGNIVISNLQDMDNKPLVHIERPGCPDGEIISWNTSASTHAIKMSSVLDMKMSERSMFTIKPMQIETDGQRTIRKISGVHMGENILVNGVVIGKAETENIGIVVENGFVTSIEGGTVKEHGIEKLHNYENKVPIDIKSAWVKSGSLRRSDFTPRIGRNIESSIDSGSSTCGKVVMIDHAAEYCFELADGAQFAVTVGDDTTSIAGDILYRLGIPIIGITDGDFDGLSQNTHIYPGSIILRLRSGHDDIVGRHIIEELFGGKNTASFDTFKILKRKIIKIAGDSIISFVHY
ncbi:MAG: DUF2117 domain-containing protein [Methanosarcinaceae archaeon]|nr:DUF2117 domain-containing protein [Methanosarcinaceae archaeon]